MEYNEKTLLVKAIQGEPGILNRVTPHVAGWEWLHFEARYLTRGQRWTHRTDQNEAALVILGGQCTVQSDKGTWENIGRRENVFAGMPYAVYLPRRTDFEVVGVSARVEFAYGWVASDEDHPARLITPADSQIEIRGGRSATRQINSILPPGSDCHRLVVVEVYTPGGNWSSYPPHKHDVHREDAEGNLLEADLEEIYYYRFDRPEGYAVQRVYNDVRTVDSAVVAHDNDVVLVPEGYHPVSAAYGYDCYYLNLLAGSAQSLANSDDPVHAWTKDTWDVQDPRLPLVSHAMET